jgi:hypothetical protein
MLRLNRAGDIILSEEGLKECGDLDYLFTPEGSHDKDEAYGETANDFINNIGV